MPDSLCLDIVTPTGPIASASNAQTPAVEVPGLLGEMGILPTHVPLISPVRPGVVRFRSDTDSVRVAVGRGFVEVSEDGRVSVLVNRAVDRDSIDATEVKSQLADVTKELASLKGSDDLGTLARLEAQRQWLEAQLRAAQ